jgi:inosine-uridine nucleoside N-ribohydrolase
VKSLPANEMLHILTLGVMTNIASAVMIAPEIVSRIKVYALGPRYDQKKKAWNKNEFNVRNDLNGFDYLLNLENFDLTIMPSETAFPLKFSRDETYAHLDESVEIEKILENRWREQNPQDATRILWDLALVEAYLNPKISPTLKVMTPPENTPRFIHIYKSIDAKALTDDFYFVLKRK